MRKRYRGANAPGTLADAASAVARIIAISRNADAGSAKPQRREQLRVVRQLLDANCQARFTLGLEEDLLMPLLPLRQLGKPAPSETVRELEQAARGPRLLEIAARHWR